MGKIGAILSETFLRYKTALHLLEHLLIKRKRSILKNPHQQSLWKQKSSLLFLHKPLIECRSYFCWVFNYFIINFELDFGFESTGTKYTINALPCSLHIGSRLTKIRVIALFCCVYQVAKRIVVSFEVSNEWRMDHRVFTQLVFSFNTPMRSSSNSGLT